MATTYIQFTGRLKATSQEGILAEAQQVAISSTDNTNVKDYIDKQIAAVKGNISSVAGSVYRPKGSLSVANFKALTSAAVGDVYNITEEFTLSGRKYPAYTNVACVKAFSAAVTPDDSYWDALGGTVDLSPYAKTADVNTKVDTINKSISDNVSSLITKISTAQSTANTANDAANANKTSISGLTTRVSTLESSDHVNKINTVKVNGTALTPDGNKAVNIPLVTTSAAGLMSTDDKQKVDWSRKYIQQGDADHPFLKGTLDADAFTYNIGWMLDGYTYNNAVKIPLLNEEQAGLVDSQSYEDYIQPLLQGKYDERIDKKVDAVAGKGLSTNDFTTDEKNKLAGIASGAQVNVIEKVKLNGADLVPDSEKRVNLGSLITDKIITDPYTRILGKVSIGSSLRYGEEAVYVGDGAIVGNYAKLFDNAFIGTGVRVESGFLSVSSGNILYYGTGSASVEVARQTDIISLQSRVTALENLLKLA